MRHITRIALIFFLSWIPQFHRFWTQMRAGSIYPGIGDFEGEFWAIVQKSAACSLCVEDR